jgi:hypothetical protein
MYMSREGQLQNYNECKEEALEFYKNNNLLWEKYTTVLTFLMNLIS